MLSHHLECVGLSVDVFKELTGFLYRLAKNKPMSDKNICGENGLFKAFLGEVLQP